MVTATITPDDPTPKSFPKLMILNSTHPYSGRIVLFTEERKGTVIRLSVNEDYLTVGYFDTKWNMDIFSDFSGTITLKNS